MTNNDKKREEYLKKRIEDGNASAFLSKFGIFIDNNDEPFGQVTVWLRWFYYAKTMIGHGLMKVTSLVHELLERLEGKFCLICCPTMICGKCNSTNVADRAWVDIHKKIVGYEIPECNCYDEYRDSYCFDCDNYTEAIIKNEKENMMKYF